MKSFLCTIVAVTALSLGTLFASPAVAGHGGHNHGGHNHGGHGGHNHGGHNHGGHYQNHGGYRPYNSGYGYGGYSNQYQQNGMYFRGSNFGVRIGF